MKKTILIIVIMILAVSLASAGGSRENSNSKLTVIATVFPEYDWVREILGDNPAGIETTLLLDNGVDLHSFQPSADDVVAISTCDLFIYVGGESDEWVDDILENAVNRDIKVINLIEALGDLAREEEIKEGMQAEEHDHEDQDSHGHEEEEAEYDEHVWLSLRNAGILCSCIADALCDLDPRNADVYRANLLSYRSELAELDLRYEAVVSGGSVRTLLFGDRFPFRYLADDYGLDYYAAFAGCSAESEASFETIAFLVDKLNSLGLRSVMTIEGSDGKIARTIVASSVAGNQEILTMDSLQSVTAEDVRRGVTYLKVMEENLKVLEKALN